jgi:flavin-dependent dehydrogenase
MRTGEMKADIVIVGAGLAGLSAAAEIAAHSRAEVILVERLGPGSNNPTPLVFRHVFEQYGLQDCAIGRYNRFTFHSPLGNRSSHAYDDFPLAALNYQAACRTLLERARRMGNVQELHANALSMSRAGEQWELYLSRSQRLTAPLVIDASGRGLFSSRILGLPLPRSYSHCYGARLAGCKAPDENEAFFLAPCEAYGDGGGWFYPLKNGQVSFGYATLGTDPNLPGRVVKERFERALKEFQPYASWLRGAEVDHVEVGTIPIYPLRKFVYDGLLIAGDAASQATIWSCMGSEAALEAGQLAGAAALDALLRGDYRAESLKVYQTVWDERNRRTYRHNAWIAPVVWSMGEGEWNRQIPRVQELTPRQMLDRLRINWPVPTLAQAAFVRGYDLAGRMRRGVVRKLRKFIPLPGRSAVQP